MKAYLVDAYDSFVYIIYQYLQQLGLEARVVRNDAVTPGDIEAFAPDMLVLGPGPGHPSEAHYVPLVQRYGGKVPILGVCLGHQAIGLAFGGKVSRASHLMHGKTSLLDHDGQGIFRGRPHPLQATRYHSLIVEEQGLPDVLQISARSEDDGYVMAMRHKTWPIESVQFHPESIYTQDGLTLFQNFIDTHVKPR